MKGIILAGGAGTRLLPLTACVSKQLLPIYDKPMIYYPLSTLMLLGMREILVISTPNDTPVIAEQLGNGAELGIQLSYAVQQKPGGLPEAFLIGEEFIGDDSVCLMLGDNLLFWSQLRQHLSPCTKLKLGASILCCTTTEPERFGIAEINSQGQIVSLEEKPKRPRSNQAIIGLYFYDTRVAEMTRRLEPSARGELEITDLNRLYLQDDSLNVVRLTRGTMWIDTGTPESLLQAANFVSIVQRHQGLMVGSPEEVAYNMCYIDADSLKAITDKKYRNSAYGLYLNELVLESQGTNVFVSA